MFWHESNRPGQQFFGICRRISTSWWLNQATWKKCSSKWIISPGRDENKKSLKPPSRFSKVFRFHYHSQKVIGSLGEESQVSILGGFVYAHPFDHLFPAYEILKPQKNFTHTSRHPQKNPGIFWKNTLIDVSCVFVAIKQTQTRTKQQLKWETYISYIIYTIKLTVCRDLFLTFEFILFHFPAFPSQSHAQNTIGSGKSGILRTYTPEI